MFTAVHYFAKSAAKLSCLLAVSSCLSIPSAQAGLVLQYDPSLNFETFIVNTGAMPVMSGGYQITDTNGGLMPTEWNSIADTVAADFGLVIAELGAGALSFGELSAMSNFLAEGALTGSAAWDPGQSWSIGHPFGRTEPVVQAVLMEAEFRYLDDAMPGSPAVVGSISAVPEPSLGYLALLLTGLATVVHRECKRRRSAGHGNRA